MSKLPASEELQLINFRTTRIIIFLFFLVNWLNFFWLACHLKYGLETNLCCGLSLFSFSFWLFELISMLLDKFIYFLLPFPRFLFPFLIFFLLFHSFHILIISILIFLILNLRLRWCHILLLAFTFLYFFQLYYFFLDFLISCSL